MLDVVKGNRADIVFQKVRADILAARLRPCQKLKISDLTAKYEVSLGVVREALSRLVSEGLVEAESQKGFRVASIERDDLIDLSEARIRIEQICLSGAIAKGDVRWEGEILSAHHCLKNTPEREPDDPEMLGEEWAATHMRLHDALVAACDNTWLMRVRRMLYERSERYRRLSVPLAHDIRDVAAEHAALVEAVLNREEKLAADRIRDHLSRTTNILLNGGIDFRSGGIAKGT